MAKKTEFLTGKIVVDCDFKSTVPTDAPVCLKDLGVTSIELIDSYRIRSIEDKREVARIVGICSARTSAIVDDYKPKKAEAHGAHSALCENERQELAPWVTIRKVADRELERYDAEQTRLRLEQEAKERREAAERQRVADEEAARIQREADAKAEELRKQGLLKQATKVAAEAAVKAEEVQAAAAESEIGTIARTPPKIAGLGELRKWKGRLKFDEKNPDGPLMDLIRAIAKGDVALRQNDLVLLDINESALNARAERIQNTELGIPGCEGYTKFHTRSSRSQLADLAPSRQEEESWL